MHIYIDESGTFTFPPDGRHTISCVAALALPTSNKDTVFGEFQGLRHVWGQGSTEIKGSSLNESQIRDVVLLLNRFDALVEVCATDMGLYTADHITEHKKKQADNLTKHLAPSHHPQLIKQINDYKTALLRTADQSYLQSTLTIELIDRLIRVATLYYCQRLPKELGAFHWTIDAKDKRILPTEEYWRTFMLPYFEWRSIRRPLAELAGGDYSYFERFRLTLDTAPAHIRNDLADPTSRFEAIDIKTMMTESFKFADSKQDLGLQLVDIIANATRRAFNGKLRKEGWQNLGSLFVKTKPQTLRFVYLADPRLPRNQPMTMSRQFATVVEELERKAKPMLLTHPRQSPWIGVIRK